MTQHAPLERSGKNWLHLRHDVRQFVQSYPTCEKIDARHKTIHASQFVLSTLKTIERISIDSIGSLPSDLGIKYIIAIIFLSQGTPSFRSRKLRQLPQRTPYGDIRADLRCLYSQSPTLAHSFSMTYVHILLRDGYQTSKEENGTVEKANKEVNRQIGNILFNLGPVKNWPRLLSTIP